MNLFTDYTSNVHNVSQRLTRFALLPSIIMNPANKKCFFHQRFLRKLVKLTIGLGLVYIVYVWTNQPGASIRNGNSHHRSPYIFSIQGTKEFNSEECRIAQHFATDTLPGLMRRGLIKKYGRNESGNVLFVAGKLWKERSRFFKESLLSEVLVYNKVNGYALDTRIIDHRSQRLYAHAVSADRKEFFD